MSTCYRGLFVAALALVILPGFALAQTSLGLGQLSNVTPLDAGCVAGPTGVFTEAWDVEQGKTYRLTLTNVTDCANGGTDATMNMRINSTDQGNFELVATNQGVGIYQVDFTMPADATCTYVVFYCTTPGDGSSGFFARRQDGGANQAHLRSATFQAGCTAPVEIIGPSCDATPSLQGTWGRLKTLYR